MLRPAEPSDVPYIQSVLNAPDNHDKLAEYSDIAIATAIASAGMVVVVWEENGVPAGFCWLVIHCDGSGKGTKIEEFGVSLPGQGVGSKFFTAILDHVKAIACPTPLWLAVAGDNHGAIRFYERFGFVTTETKPKVWQRRKGPIADAVLMTLKGS